METNVNTSITVNVTVHCPIEMVWKKWTEPKHIMQWSFASDDWHAPKAQNDLKTDGKFSTTMAARDGSISFNFEGIYNEVVPHEVIDYTLLDGRRVVVLFESAGGDTTITENFEPEDINAPELQKHGWQAILNNFKKYCETPGL